VNGVERGVGDKNCIGMRVVVGLRELYHLPSLHCSDLGGGYDTTASEVHDLNSGELKEIDEVGRHVAWIRRGD